MQETVGIDKSTDERIVGSYLISDLVIPLSIIELFNGKKIFSGVLKTFSKETNTLNKSVVVGVEEFTSEDGVKEVYNFQRIIVKNEGGYYFVSEVTSKDLSKSKEMKTSGTLDLTSIKSIEKYLIKEVEITIETLTKKDISGMSASSTGVNPKYRLSINGSELDIKAWRAMLGCGGKEDDNFKNAK